MTAFAKFAGIRVTQRVLLEVDCDCEVTLALEDTLSGELFLAKKQMLKHKFRGITVEDLRLGRRYAVRLIAFGSAEIMLFFS